MIRCIPGQGHWIFHDPIILFPDEVGDLPKVPAAVHLFGYLHDGVFTFPHAGVVQVIDIKIGA